MGVAGGGSQVVIKTGSLWSRLMGRETKESRRREYMLMKLIKNNGGTTMFVKLELC